MSSERFFFDALRTRSVLYIRFNGEGRDLIPCQFRWDTMPETSSRTFAAHPPKIVGAAYDINPSTERVKAMKKQTGERNFPLWLLGDSEPDRWRQHLEAPFDPRHPIRHNIWTSVLDVVQEKVFRHLRQRVDARKMFVRNAVQDPAVKLSEPFNPLLTWHPDAQAALNEYRQMIVESRFKIIFTFGWFAFAFALRAVGEQGSGSSLNGSQTAHIGNEFRRRVAAFDIDRTNVLPLLHRSIAGGSFLSGHSEFCGKADGNCFEEAGRAIAGVLIRHHRDIGCWIDTPAVHWV